MADRYNVKLKGLTPLLMHKDNIEWGERVKAWTKHPNNSGKSIAGDDRSPAWTWIGRCYVADGALVVDSDSLMSMLRDAGKKCPNPKGRGTLKAQTQSGIIVNEIGWPVMSGNGAVPFGKIEALENEEDFGAHKKVAAELGFELFVKRAVIGRSKHVRVRPRFDAWTAEGTITVLDDVLAKDVIETLFEQGGRRVGLCDWRPGSKTPGAFGMFEAEIRKA